MRKVCAVLMVISICSAFIVTSVAGASAWQQSQRRMRKAHVDSQRQRADFWKKFNPDFAEMEVKRDGPAQKAAEPGRDSGSK